MHAVTWRIQTSFMLLITLMALTTEVRAQQLECACDGVYSVGDRVVLLVDVETPWGGQLPTGSKGTVVCGNDWVNYLWIEWDNWTDGYVKVCRNL